jgi:phosphoglycerate dehydrogenase-like enzyme
MHRKSTGLKVLFLPNPKLVDPWHGDVIGAVGARHSLKTIEYDAPLKPQFNGVDAVIDFGGSMGTRAMADQASSVRLWQILGTGFDHFDLEYWKKKQIPVANCPGEFTAVPLAECAMMFMLMLARGWTESQHSLQQRSLCLPCVEELAGRWLALVGFGSSARELAVRARAFGMHIAAIDVRDITPKEKSGYGLEFVGKPSDLNHLLRIGDYVSLHLHLNAETRHMIGGPQLKLMKPTARLINVARGGLVDEEELYRALTNGTIAGAGIDVFDEEPVDPDNPLLKLPNVVATPHIAGVTAETSRRRALCAAQNIDRLAQNLEVLYRIDQ